MNYELRVTPHSSHLILIRLLCNRRSLAPLLVDMQGYTRPFLKYGRNDLPLPLHLFGGRKERLVASNGVEKYSLVRVRDLVRERAFREGKREAFWLQLKMKSRFLRPEYYRNLRSGEEAERENVLMSVCM